MPADPAHYSRRSPAEQFHARLRLNSATRLSRIDWLWSPQTDPKRPAKQDVVTAMLRQPEGATVDEVASVTGWQRHTVRGVFSGTLKKKLGLALASAKEERGRVYRIAEPASL